MTLKRILRANISASLASVLSLGLVVGGGAALAGGSVAMAQTQQPPTIEWDARRLSRLERNLWRLERALTQRNAAGEPVLLEPDPEVVALMGRVDLLDQRLSDLESTLVRVNGETERLTMELEAAERVNRDLAGRLDALTRRIAELDSARAEAEAEAAAAAAEAAAIGGPVPRSPSGSETGDFDAAMRLVRDGDSAAASEAFELFIVTWPESERQGEAHYRLASLRETANDNDGAIQDYARALRGWPATSWAAEATLRLAAILISTDRDEQACQALGEFDRRYAERASPNGRARAGQLHNQAECG